MLEQERQFYQQNLKEWLTNQQGKFVLIKGQELIGFFNTTGEALAEGARQFGLSSFLVRKIEEVQEEIKVPALTLGLLNASSTHPVRS